MGVERVVWLARRLSRMYWQEVPYRVTSVLRGLLQARGLLDARVVPPWRTEVRWGRPWCSAPSRPAAAESLRREAEHLLQGELSVFGQAVAFADGVPDWNTDPVTRQSIPLTFGLGIDFRHMGAGIDIKHLWELNRHLWWVRLAQAWSVFGDRRYLDRLGLLLNSWMDACPYPMGSNWSSPVEHGIRLINWSIVWALIGGDRSPLFEGEGGAHLRQRWLDCIYQHMRFASDNYSRYSSADNHLIGEAAGIFVAAHTWDCWADTAALRHEAKAILLEETGKQFSPDGVNLEQAFCYHKFSLQFLLAAGLCGEVNSDGLGEPFWHRILSALVFMAAVTDSAGAAPRFGDADDGDVWHLAAGDHSKGHLELLSIGARLFDHAGLAAKCDMVGGAALREHAAWVVSPPTLPSLPPEAAALELPRYFPVGGYALLGHRLHRGDELRVLLDCGPLGYNRIAGHGHADALSLTLSAGGEALLVDSGTYCYNASPELRRFFRGSSAHNTLRVDGEDHSLYGASFLWLRDVRAWVQDSGADHAGFIHACHDGYQRLRDPVVHNRRVAVSDDGEIVVEDWLACDQPHRVELFWHCDSGMSLTPGATPGEWHAQAARHGLTLQLDGVSLEAEVVCGALNPVQGWVSDRFYSKQPAPVLVVRAVLAPQQQLRTRLRVALVGSDAKAEGR